MLIGWLSREANTSVSPNSLYIPIYVFPFAERLHLSPSRKQQQFFKSYFQTKLLGGRLCAWRGRGTNGLRHTYFCMLNTRPERTGTRARARVCPTRSRSPPVRAGLRGSRVQPAPVLLVPKRQVWILAPAAPGCAAMSIIRCAPCQGGGSGVTSAASCWEKPLKLPTADKGGWQRVQLKPAPSRV